MGFERAVGLDELAARDGCAVFRSGRLQILVTRVGDAVHALDNRCPHEGYPLSKGTTDAESCTLTCNWHNWKFRLSDGHAVIGNDAVRVYPTRVEDGAVWVDTSPPPREQVLARVMAGLEKGVRKRNFGQIARELARLHLNGADPLDGVRRAIVLTHDRLEFGTTHAYAALADWLALHDEAGENVEERLIPLAETIDHMAHDALRHPVYAFPTEALPFDADAYLLDVERGDDAAACARVLGAWNDGLGVAELGGVLARAALAHYADFGHSLIYVAKAREAAVRLADRDVDRALLLAITRSFCYATREDLIPEFRAYAPALERLATGRPPAASPPATLIGSGVEQAVAWTEAALATRAPEDVYDELLAANADSLLRYDTRFGTHVDRPVSQNTTWLSSTHSVTFANAVRTECTRQPELWAAGLQQMACFLGRNAPFTDREQDVSAWTVGDEPEFVAQVKSRLLDHGIAEPIFSSHLLKTAVAVFSESTVASAGTRALLLAGLNRFLSSPIKAKHVRRLVRQGIALVSRDFEG